MRVQDILKLSTRMFKTNPSRTWLTILGMGVGTSAVVMLVGLGFGLQGILLEQIVLGDTLLSLNVTNPSSRVVELNDASVERILALENVRDVALLTSFPALMTFEGLTANIALQALEPAYFRYAGLRSAEGDIFFEETAAEDREKILLTTGALKLFAVEDPAEAVGKVATFRLLVPRAGTTEVVETSLPRSYEVKGIIDSPATIAAYIPLQELAAHIQVTTFERAQVRVESTDFLSSVQDELVDMGFAVTALSKTVDQANKIFQGVQAVLALFGGIALIVSAIGMFNTMTVTLLERTGEIGIMRTIGAAPNDIKILFLMEAIIVGILGGLVGILIGVVFGWGVNAALNVVAVRFGGVSMSLFRYPIPFLVFIQTFSALVGFITGVFPARRAASLNPLDAIRYK